MPFERHLEFFFRVGAYYGSFSVGVGVDEGVVEAGVGDVREVGGHFVG